MSKGNMEGSYDYTKDFGLKLLGELDEETLRYEFNKIGIFQHIKSGKVFYAHTSGCSCPGGYHEFNFVSILDNNLREITSHSMENFKMDVMNFPAAMDKKILFIELVPRLKGE